MGMRQIRTGRHLEASYFKALETDPNVDLRLVPKPFTTGMIMTAIPAAIRPYSMAVAPDSSLRKAVSLRRMLPALLRDALALEYAQRLLTPSEQRQ
jgi:hypothetical protein